MRVLTTQEEEHGEKIKGLDWLLGVSIDCPGHWRGSNDNREVRARDTDLGTHQWLLKL